MYDMTEKEQKLIDSAIVIFFRYGVRKTTMADIASAAGVSRQTLYASFSSKDEILAAAIGRVCEDTLAYVWEAWRTCASLAEKLDAFFDICVVRIYDQVQVKPDSEDLVSGYGAAGAAAIAAAHQSKSQALSQILVPYDRELATLDLTPDALADFVQTSIAGYKQSARDRDHLLSLLATLRTVVLKVTGQSV